MPNVYRSTGPGSAPTIQSDDDDESNPAAGAAPQSGTITSADGARRRTLAEILGEPRVDLRAAAEAQRIAGLLSIRSQISKGHQRGRRRPRSARFDGSADDLDVDATLELLAERRPFGAEDLTVRRPTTTRRSIALLADVSGSMTGDKAIICAAAVGALVGELADEELTVIAFWSDLAVVCTRESRLEPRLIIDQLIRIEPRGLTNVHAAIELAAAELATSSLERRSIILLSDCVHNAGPDPRTAARRAPRTHVLLDRTGEHDAWLGERIARAGGGRYRSIGGLTDVAPALDALFSN